MKIDQIFIYPIKSLPGIPVESAKIDSRGFEADRRFVLISPAEGDLKAKFHAVSNSPLNTQIAISISPSPTPTLHLTSPTGNTFSLPLHPPTKGLARVPIDMYNSCCEGFDMGDDAAAFFAAACAVGRKVRGIAFTDHGSFLLTTTSSLSALSSQLPTPISIAPLRPNIVLRPATRNHALPAHAEDFWSELKIGRGGIVMRLTANCGRYGFSPNVGDTIRVGDTVVVTRRNKEHTTFDWPY
ncbi:hypothetical protein RQP46_009332 [Phenoliferia psychrophenolica]